MLPPEPLARAQDLAIVLLELCVGLASFTGCMVAVDKLFLFYSTIFYKAMAFLSPDRYEPTRRYPCALKRNAKHPRVLVQLPMFNETHVAARIIEYACRMEYPRDRFEVQVLDDSTDAQTRAVVDDAIDHWRSEGIAISVVRRTNRQGFKAGAMHEVHDAIEAELIAIFDADFLPERDFLLKAVPYFQHKSIGFVQGRWTYLNADESLFCRYQEICLNAHIKCEQYGRFATGNFFNFNGTGGVWRKACITDAGGWNARTLVEDMDLSLRAFLRGWQFVWVYDIHCPNEIPSDYKAYRKQQRRWSCGPMQLWAAAREQVLQSSLPPLQKAYLNIFFFGARMLATNVISFTFYSVLVPLTLLHFTSESEAEATGESEAHHRFMPWWAIVWLPLLVTASTMAFSPESFHFMILYVMYENAMSILKLGASLEGLLGLKGSMTWTVTQKLGANASRSFELSKVLSNISCFGKEMACGLFLLCAAVYGRHVGASWVFQVYFATQGFIFVVFSLSLVEALNLQPPPEWQLLGLPPPPTPAPSPGALPPLTEALTGGRVANERRRRREQRRRRKKKGYEAVTLGQSDEDSAEELEALEGGGVDDSGNALKRQQQIAPAAPSFLRVIYANAVIFAYTLPLNALSIALLYGVTTMALSEMNTTQWDDLIALSLALVLVPGHLCLSLGSPRANIEHRRLARKGRLPFRVWACQCVSLAVLYFLLLLLFLISMYSASATLQQHVSRLVHDYTGKYLEEYLD